MAAQMGVELDQEPPILLRPEEVGRLLALGRTTVHELIARGELSSVRFGRALRVPRSDVERLIAVRAGGNYRPAPEAA